MCDEMHYNQKKGRSTGGAGHPKQIDVTARSQESYWQAHASMVPHGHPFATAGADQLTAGCHLMVTQSSAIGHREIALISPGSGELMQDVA
jgi:hypothetical protein